MFRISKLVFSERFQYSPESEINIEKINIIVGPNNSGKSTVLKDIEEWFEDRKYPNMKLLKGIELSFTDSLDEYHEFQKNILEFEDGERTGQGENQLIWLSKEHIFHGSHTNNYQYNLKNIKDEFERKNIKYFREHFFKYFVIRLDGRNRFQSVNAQPLAIFRTSKTARNYLTRLYLRDGDQKRLREIIHDGIGWYPYLEKRSENDTEYLHILLSEVPPDGNNNSIQEKDIQPLKKMVPITEFGDGFHCFIGICISILSYPYRIVLLDEPEAFLHPPTAYSLAKNLSRWIEYKYRSLIVSTHSAEFLMGCLQSASSSEISIIRLTYQNDIGTVRKLESNEISKYVTDSFLRSTEVLNALFYNSAVVAESWNDKVTYQEANNKLLRYKRGIDNTIFLNVNGKDSVHRIIIPLRRIGIPAAAIYDLDVLKDRVLFKTILYSSNIEYSMIEYFEGKRQCVKSEIDTLYEKKEEKEQDYFKNLPTDKIPAKLKEMICELLNGLKIYGIFIVPIGELEQWLKKVQHRKPDKPFIMILNKIQKTTPTHDDIWQFIDDINIWTSNPDRKGMI